MVFLINHCPWPSSGLLISVCLDDWSLYTEETPHYSLVFSAGLGSVYPIRLAYLGMRVNLVTFVGFKDGSQVPSKHRWLPSTSPWELSSSEYKYQEEETQLYSVRTQCLQRLREPYILHRHLLCLCPCELLTSHSPSPVHKNPVFCSVHTQVILPCFLDFWIKSCKLFCL